MHEYVQVIPWPAWVDTVTIISHLALTISCSLSFYIYYGKYGAPKQVLNRKMTKMKKLLKTSTEDRHREEYAEDMTLPDMNEITMDTTIQETSLNR